MRSLSAFDLLDILERGTGRTPIEQALVLLGVAFPQVPKDVLVKLNVGQRDLCLLHMRSLTFGTKLKALIDCQECSERLELEFDTKNLSPSISPVLELEAMTLSNLEISFRWADYEVHFRLPNSADLSSLADTKNVLSGRQQLIEACVISAKRGDAAVSANDLPPEVVNGLIDHMSQVDSLADLTFAITCPACGHVWDIIFDIVSFFWGEINAWSARLIREVHSLATAYGWCEADILAMSAWRRKQYLELIGV